MVFLYNGLHILRLEAMGTENVVKLNVNKNIHCPPPKKKKKKVFSSESFAVFKSGISPYLI